jgi:uncharacterized membrane protein YfcA
MDIGSIGMIVLCAVSIITSSGFHYRIRNILFASLLSAVTASIIFQIIGYFVLGYLDPFFLISLFTGAGIAFAISIIIGIPFAYKRGAQTKLRGKS